MYEQAVSTLTLVTFRYTSYLHTHGITNWTKWEAFLHSIHLVGKESRKMHHSQYIWLGTYRYLPLTLITKKATLPSSIISSTYATFVWYSCKSSCTSQPFTATVQLATGGHTSHRSEASEPLQYRCRKCVCVDWARSNEERSTRNIHEHKRLSISMLCSTYLGSTTPSSYTKKTTVWQQRKTKHLQRHAYKLFRICKTTLVNIRLSHMRCERWSAGTDISICTAECYILWFQIYKIPQRIYKAARVRWVLHIRHLEARCQCGHACNRSQLHVRSHLCVLPRWAEGGWCLVW